MKSLWRLESLIIHLSNEEVLLMPGMLYDLIQDGALVEGLKWEFGRINGLDICQLLWLFCLLKFLIIQVTHGTCHSLSPSFIRSNYKWHGCSRLCGMGFSWVGLTAFVINKSIVTEVFGMPQSLFQKLWNSILINKGESWVSNWAGICGMGYTVSKFCLIIFLLLLFPKIVILLLMLWLKLPRRRNVLLFSSPLFTKI